MVSSGETDVLCLGRGGILNPLLVVELLVARGSDDAGGPVALVLVTSLSGSHLLARRSRISGLSPFTADEWPLTIAVSETDGPRTLICAFEDSVAGPLTLVSWPRVSSMLAIVKSCLSWLKIAGFGVTTLTLVPDSRVPMTHNEIIKTFLMTCLFRAPEKHRKYGVTFRHSSRIRLTSPLLSRSTCLAASTLTMRCNDICDAMVYSGDAWGYPT